MAIAFDNAADSGAVAVTSPQTWSHTVSGSNTALFVSVIGAVGAADVVTGITYSGVPLTKLTDVRIPGDREFDIWYLLGAATGANTISVAFTGTFASGMSVSYNGVSQGALDASGTGTAASGTSYTQSLSTVANNCWVLGAFGNSNRLTSADTGTTQRVNQSAISGLAFVDNNVAVTSGTSVTLGVTQLTAPISSGWAGIMVSIAPFTGVAANHNAFLLMGIG